MKTEKFNNMISSFQCDFSLAKEGKNNLSELDKKIKEHDERLLKDIKLLEELDYMLRSGQAEIHLEFRRLN